ncbi:hypothetical protein SFRURICE_016370 [Spodoptera frugiperda]|nr:hypothetical protein SFRURICE_016370 [Spodoptera frugiperda]
MESGKAIKNLEKGKSQKGKRSSKSGSKATRPRRGIHSGANRTPLSLVRIKQMSEQYIHNELYLDEEPRRECIIPKEEEGELCQSPLEPSPSEQVASRPPSRQHTPSTASEQEDLPFLQGIDVQDLFAQLEPSPPVTSEQVASLPPSTTSQQQKLPSELDIDDQDLLFPELGPSPNPPSTASQEHFHFFLKVSTAYLMAFVIKRLDNAKNKQDIEDYRRVNTDLEAQIAQLEASRNAQAPPVVPSDLEPPALPQPDMSLGQDLDDLNLIKLGPSQHQELPSELDIDDQDLLFPELEQLTSQFAPLITSVLADCDCRVYMKGWLENDDGWL